MPNDRGPISPSFGQPKINDLQKALLGRSPSAAYRCPLCGVNFTQEPKLWSHRVEQHLDTVQQSLQSPEDEARERRSFREKAMLTAQEKGTPTSSPAVGISSPTPQRVLLGSTMQLPSFGSLVRDAGTPGVSTPMGVGSNAEERTPSTSNPLKRTNASSGSPEPSADQLGIYSTPTRARHAKTRSFGQVTKEGDIERPKMPTSHLSSLNAEGLGLDQSPAAASASPRRPRHTRTSSRGHQRQRSGAHRAATQPTIPQQNAFKFNPPILASTTIGPPATPLAGVSILQRSSDRTLKVNTNVVGGAEKRAVSGKAVSEADEAQPPVQMLRQLLTDNTIDHDKLVAETKSIYAGLVVVEHKTIEVYKNQIALVKDPNLLPQNPLTAEQYRTLITLQKQLLHEHHDFLLATQHPSANPNLKRLPAKYSMPARLWRHGIHGFLEILRHRLPESYEHMLAFMYVAYSMVALLYETVPAFRNTWVECLGDLGRFRMAIENDTENREVWREAARYWYCHASSTKPNVGRLYHHCGILAKAFTLEQLALYLKALTCIEPFESTRGSIRTLLEPVLAGDVHQYYRGHPSELQIIGVHGMLFYYQGRVPDASESTLANIVSDLGTFPVEAYFKDQYTHKRLRKSSAYLAFANLAVLFEYGALTPRGGQRSKLRAIFDKAPASVSNGGADKPDDGSVESLREIDAMSCNSADADSADTKISNIIFECGRYLAFSTLRTALDKRFWLDPMWPDILPFVHVMLVVIWAAQSYPDAMALLETSVPWHAVANFLSHLSKQSQATTPRVFESDMPGSDKKPVRPLWEDFVLRGYPCAKHVFPADWFADENIDDEERQIELKAMDFPRMERILWLGYRLSTCQKWMTYDKERKFEVTNYAKNMGPRVENLSRLLDDEPLKPAPPPPAAPAIASSKQPESLAAAPESSTQAAANAASPAVVLSDELARAQVSDNTTQESGQAGTPQNTTSSAPGLSDDVTMVDANSRDDLPPTPPVLSSGDGGGQVCPPNLADAAVLGGKVNGAEVAAFKGGPVVPIRIREPEKA